MGAISVAPAVAEVDAAGQLADHQQIGAGHQIGAQRAGAEQRRAGPHRAQVRVQAETLAQPQQALLGPRGGRVGRVPLRPSDGAEQDGVGAPARLQRLVGERGPVQVDRRAADHLLGELELADRLQQAASRRDDLGADPVAGQQGYPGPPVGGGHGRRAEMFRRT